jgi:ATP-dependent Lon protease
VLRGILRGYTREAGVRELERRLARLARKLARERAERWRPVPRGPVAGPTARSAPQVAGSGLLRPDDDPDAVADQGGRGVRTGLHRGGGEVLEIEVSVLPGRGRLQLTGTLGDVMKESAVGRAQRGCARAPTRSASALDFHQKRDLHVHMPAGATPKDGPSAGIAIATRSPARSPDARCAATSR